MADLLITHEEYLRRYNLPLKDKVDMSIERIESWYDYWKGMVYISFSGGKDSTVVLDLVRSVFPEVPAVYCDTGLEYPELKDFVRGFPNIEITKPKLTYRQVIEKWGYPVVSKEQSMFLYDYRTSNSEKLKDIRLNGNKWGMGKISKKWRYLINAPFKISDKCCDVLKKSPAKRYERISKRKGYLGTTADESTMRKMTYLKWGCNAYNANRPISTPLSFWSRNDILQYCVERGIKLAPIYGEILQDESGNFYTTGVERTGCMWCLFGLDKEQEPNRIQKLKVTHPKIYDYCISNLGIGDVLDFMDIPY